MGCGWVIHIQARYGDKWVTVHGFYTKTRRGGEPIRGAMRTVAAEHAVNGKYGIEFPTDTPFGEDEYDSYMDGHDHLSDQLEKLERIYSENGSLKKKRKHDSNSKDTDAPLPLSPQEVLAKRSSLRSKIKIIEDRHTEAGKIGDFPAHHYFIISQEDFEKFITCVPRERVQFRGEQCICYNKLLRPLGRWTEMMKTANPYEEFPPSMHEEDELIDGTTKDIEALQTARQEETELSLGNLGVVAHKFCLPVSLKHRVREYLDPLTAKDMRIAIYDEEKNAKRIRDGDLRERQEPEQCVIM